MPARWSVFMDVPDVMGVPVPMPVLVLVLAVAIDLVAGEMPNTIHPVVWLGTLIYKISGWCERTDKRYHRICGLVLVLICVSCAAATGVLLTLLAERHSLIGIVLMAYFLKSTFSIRSLVSSSNLIYRDLSVNDIESARKDLLSLVSRDAGGLDEPKIASAAIESTAENYVDSILSPILYFTVFGLPGALVYKAVNTLDSMVGYRNERFSAIGFVSAKLDDIANWIPARLSILFILLPSFRFSPVSALRVCLRDHALPASPNSGYPMAMVAGALGCRLEKPGSYVLGREYPDPSPHNILQANWVVMLASFLLIAVAVVAVAVILPSNSYSGIGTAYSICG
ncbi:cobalamin biosynthesis protein [Methanosarcinales archaeon]|nr:MAG: cobalamin biosynthesis protein [Methanosarcinales archaeon]